MFEETPPIPTLVEAIHDPSNPIGMRMRSAYYLRHAYKQIKDNEGIDQDADQTYSDTIIDSLVRELGNIEHGSLMRHEFAYVLGQLQDPKACPELEACVTNHADCVMVRHEAAEALGAIGEPASIAVMQQVCDDSDTPVELRETCQLSIDLLEWKQRQEQRRQENKDTNPEDDPAPPTCACLQTPYFSVDPGLPPSSHHADLSTAQLGELLLQSEGPIQDRYQAMFSLRNRGGSEAVHWLCRALLEDTTSALLRHEVAYVLGQVQHPESVDALEESLRRTHEHKMVRHESAEALGAIDGRWDQVERILREFTNDADDVVRESCLVALDAADYWRHTGNEDDEKESDAIDIEQLGTRIQKATSSFAQVKADQRVLTNGHFNRVE
jgi:deoxyhypusine monooxygenase